MTTKKESTALDVAVSEPTFSREQILLSLKYKCHRDALTAILEDKKYTIKQVDNLLEHFMKGKV